MAKLMRSAIGLFVGVMTFASVAQQEPTVSSEQGKTVAKAAKEGIEELPSLTGSNQIPLLNNRFRVDYEVKDISLVFFRKTGSPSVVLVKPDGSKIYATTATEHNAYWHSDRTYDLIKLKDPTPGPWQAIGQILPESRIMVLTDINIKVDPLPKDLMVGEQLKMTATLANGDKPIQTKDFRDLLQLHVLLISTQKQGMANEHETVMELATLDDDGNNFDERPRDAIFTGEYRFAVKAGEWMPKYTIKTPLYTRESLQDPVTITEPPIKAELIEGTGTEKHKLLYSVSDGVIDAKTVSIQGQVIYPGGDVQSFSLPETDSPTRSIEVGNVGNGNYRVEQVVYGKTTAGRDFVLNMQDVVLRVVVPLEAPKAEPVADAAPAQSQPVIAKPVEPPPEPEPEFPLVWVIVGNLFILIAGGVAVFLAMNPQGTKGLSMLLAKLNPAALLKKKKVADDLPMSDPAGQQVAETAVKKSAKIKESDDILDLSLPDD